MSETYTPSQKELDTAEEMMSPEQRKMSEIKESIDKKRAELVLKYNQTKQELGIKGEVTSSYCHKWDESDSHVVTDKTLINIKAELDGHNIELSKQWGRTIMIDGVLIKKSYSPYEQKPEEVEHNTSFDRLFDGLYGKLFPLAEIGGEIQRIDDMISRYSDSVKFELEKMAREHKQNLLTKKFTQEEEGEAWGIAERLLDEYVVDKDRDL